MWVEVKYQERETERWPQRKDVGRASRGRAEGVTEMERGRWVEADLEMQFLQVIGKKEIIAGVEPEKERYRKAT